MPTGTLPTNRYPEERRLATVLFADVHGFTAVAEQLDFEIVSTMLKEIWSRLDRVVEEHNGYVDKHLGDGVMAVWGAPFAGDNDAEQAVSAGLDLIKALDEFCQSTTIPGAENMQLRVGINTGLVFAGYVGKRDEYTVLGDIVNVASRLEQSADPGTVVIGENTLRMVRGGFRVKRLDPAHVKGKAEKIQLYAVEGVIESPGRVRYQSADSLVTVMVGRDEELENIVEQYEKAFELPTPSMMLVSGEVGIGKSRLLMEFGNLLEQADRDISVLTTRGLSQASRIPFYLWRMLLRSRFGVKDDDSASEASEKWRQGIDSIWEAGPQEEKLEATQVIGDLIGLSNEVSCVSEEQMQRVSYLMRELLGRAAAHRRLVLLFDDLQWADRESLALLNNLMTGNDPPLQALVVAAARPEFLQQQPQWRNLAHILELGPIAFSAEMVGKAYPDFTTGLPSSILNEIAHRAEGNPYFLEEVVKSLVKSGMLHEGATDTRKVHQRLLSQVPESLRATLQVRLDSLSREARAVALLASVVGRVFWVGAVLEAARSKPMPGSTPMINIPESVIGRFVQDGLRQLVRAELAFPRSGSHFSEEQEYIFKNSYLRDVAYSLIPNRNRAQYHRAVAEWLKRKTDPAYQAMARDHERNAIASEKIATGSLPEVKET